MHCVWFAVAVVVTAGGTAKTPKRPPPPPVEQKKVVPPPPVTPVVEAKPAAVVTPPPQVEATSPPPAAQRELGFHPYSAGALLGPAFAFNGGPVVMRVGGQFEARLLDLSDTVRLELELPLLFGFGSQTVGVAGLFESTTHFFMMELAPTGQLALALAPTFDLYGGFGLGPVYSSATTAIQFQGPITSGTGGVVIRMTAGGRFRLGEKVSFFIEPIGLHIYSLGATTTRVGSFDVQTSGGTSVMYQLLLGAAYLL